MKTAFLIGMVLTVQYLSAQQRDSTEIKLQQYKDYHDKGLINEQDYDLLKEKLLQLDKYAPRQHPKAIEGIHQYDKKLTFEVRIEPVAFFDLQGAYYQPVININGKLYDYKQPLPNQQYGGMHLGFGAAWKKQYHIHFVLGFDGNQQQQMLSVGTDFSANLMPGRFAPFIHGGIGYASIGSNNGESNILQDADLPTLKGLYAGSGIGLYARLSNFFALAISPEYRFIYAPFKQYASNSNFTSFLSAPAKVFYNQLGLRVAAVFY